MHDTPCDDLRGSANLLHREADAAMREAREERREGGAFLSLVQLAARCEAVAQRVEDRIEEECAEQAGDDVCVI